MTKFHGLRRAPALGAIAVIGSLAFAYFLQYGMGLEPCPMCIFQRVAMAVAGVFFIIWAAHGPRGWPRYVYAIGALLGSAAGVFIAARHVWLQSLPEDEVPACGPTLDYLMDVMPLAEVVQTILRGDGNCAKIEGSFLGISLPGWTLVAFIGLAIWALASLYFTRRAAHPQTPVQTIEA